MNAHLRISIDDIDLVLDEDSTLQITDRSPIFNDAIETISYQISVSISKNRAHFKDIDHLDSDMRLNSLEGHPAKIWIDGVLYRNVKVGIVENQSIKDEVNISFVSANSQLYDLVGEMNLRDIRFPESDRDALKIGEMVGNISVHRGGNDDACVWGVFKRVTPKTGLHSPDWTSFDIETQRNDDVVLDSKLFDVQALGFSTNKEYAEKTHVLALTDAEGNPIVRKDFINVTVPFGRQQQQPDGTTRRALYHNSRISVIGRKKDSDDVINGDYGPYQMLEADRPQSGVCFYVLYVLEALFKHLGIAYDQRELMAVEDMCRLSFFTTLCKYDLVRKYPYFRDYDFNSVEEMNLWLDTHRTGGRLEAVNELQEEFSRMIERYAMYVPSTLYCIRCPWVKSENQFHIPELPYDDMVEWHVAGGSTEDRLFIRPSELTYRTIKTEDEIRVNIAFDYDEVTKTFKNYERSVAFRCDRLRVGGQFDLTYRAQVMNMIANAKNLPDMSVKSFLESLFASFGIRFHYDPENNTVEAFFIRDVFRSKESPYLVAGKIVEEYPLSEKITAVSMRYAAEASAQEQLANVTDKITDYNVRYDYLTENTPIDAVDTGQDYGVLINGILSVGDETLHADLITGNCYRVKIDKEKLDDGEILSLKPTLFEVAELKGVTEYADAYAELSDKEKQSETITEYIEEIVSAFEPLAQNDLYGGKNKHTTLMCPFSDASLINPEQEMDSIMTVVCSDPSRIYGLRQYISTTERYDPGQTDDRNSPLQSADWGKAITIMRGGGDGSRIQHFDENYDHFNNERWFMVAGAQQCNIDSINNYGVLYDYNADIQGLGDGERISLKIRAYHRDATGRALISDAQSPIAMRGLADSFMAEYIKFLLNRKKRQIDELCDVSYLINIPWKRRFKIGMNVGWIDSVQTSVNVKNGIENVEFVMFVL